MYKIWYILFYYFQCISLQNKKKTYIHPLYVYIIKYELYINNYYYTYQLYMYNKINMNTHILCVREYLNTS